MNFFTFDLKKIIIIVVVISVVFISVNVQRKSEKKAWFVQPFVFVTGLIQNTYSSFSSGVRGTTGLYINLVDIKKNNRTLVKANAELRAQLGALTELKLENERLNQILDFKKKTEMKLLATKVIGKDLIPDHNSITINRGSTHGIKETMAAITIGGVVGYVIEVKTFTSQILLLTDRYAAIDALVQRSRARGIVQGTTSRSCQLNYLQTQDDVQVGDLIVTSGLDNIFPKGFPVGTVTAVTKNQYDTSQKISLSPAINPFTLEEVFVVLDAQEEDFLGDDENGEAEENEESSP